jgi:hypothetical protein
MATTPQGSAFGSFIGVWLDDADTPRVFHGHRAPFYAVAYSACGLRSARRGAARTAHDPVVVANLLVFFAAAWTARRPPSVRSQTRQT